MEKTIEMLANIVDGMSKRLDVLRRKVDEPRNTVTEAERDLIRKLVREAVSEQPVKRASGRV